MTRRWHQHRTGLGTRSGGGSGVGRGVGQSSGRAV